MKYKIIYHVGDEINLKTKVEGGILDWEERGLVVAGSAPLEVSFTSMKSVEMFRHLGLARMIKLKCENRIIFMAVVRLNIAGYYVRVNFLKTGELFERLKNQIEPNKESVPPIASPHTPSRNSP